MRDNVKGRMQRGGSRCRGRTVCLEHTGAGGTKEEAVVSQARGPVDTGPHRLSQKLCAESEIQLL